jgi:hypothetical protein
MAKVRNEADNRVMRVILVAIIASPFSNAERFPDWILTNEAKEWKNSESITDINPRIMTQ